MMPKLTPREEEVLLLFADDLTAFSVAAHLGLSEHTIHQHSRNIREKFGVVSMTAAVARYYRYKIEQLKTGDSNACTQAVV